ncbi:MAG: TerB family tellurite resistance protein [Bacteroidetes bacterium]|nr:TerB family tellurite resistance protein [Bacteroidota bacterium]
MKKAAVMMSLCFALCIAAPTASRAQTIADDLEQLALDIQKLSGLKSVLKQMYQGYELVSKGYGAVKDVSQGNFTLHQAFLDGLMIVSPTVRKYPRVQDIINDQLSLVSEYKSAYSVFKSDQQITPDEIGYIMDVYNNLVSRSLDNLTALSTVITDNQVRMSDDERLRQIDRIYATGHDELTFLRQFNDQARSVALSRAQAAGDRQTIQKLYGIQ